MSGLLHHETSPWLKLSGPYATRWIVWPPEDFREPTTEELAVIRRRINHRVAHNFVTVKTTPVEWVRELQVIDWFHDHPRIRNDLGVSRYMHELRRWIAAEPNAPVFRSLRHSRCGMCSHASDRLWEATGETHNLIDRNDEPIASVFLCARCWSDYAITEE